MQYDKEQHLGNDYRQLYCLVDTKAGQFFPPFESRTDATAIRSFVDGYKDTSGVFHEHVEDFALFHVGAQDVRSGVIYAREVPSAIFRGYDLLAALPAKEEEAA